MMSARAVKPWVSKKFLAARWPGSAVGVDADARSGAAVLHQRVDDRLAHARLPRASGSTNRSVTTPRRAPERSCSTTHHAEAR